MDYEKEVWMAWILNCHSISLHCPLCIRSDALLIRVFSMGSYETAIQSKFEKTPVASSNG